MKLWLCPLINSVTPKKIQLLNLSLSKAKQHIDIPCYEYWLLLHLKKTNQPFMDAQKCCETFRAEYNKKFKTQYNLKQLKAKKNIFEDLKDGLQSAITHADSFALEENTCPYTNMHQVIKEIIER